MADDKAAEAIKGLEFFGDPADGATPAPKPADKAKLLTIPQLRKQLEANFQMLGIGLMGFDTFDGEIIVEKAPDLAKALCDLAEANPKVRRRLNSLVEVGAWGGVASLLGTQIILPIAVHHNLLPDTINGFLANQADIPVVGKENE